MYFFGKIAFVAGFFVFLATWQTLGEVFALVLAVGAWLIVLQVSKSIVQADRGRTARKKSEKQMKSLIEHYGAEVSPQSSKPAPMNQPTATERLIEAGETPSYWPGADSKNTKLPSWSNQLTPNRLEWARDKLAKGLEQGEDRSEVEQRLMFQLLEMGWIE